MDYTLAYETFMELMKICFPVSMVWGLGYVAYHSIVNAFTGKDVTLR